LRPSPDFKRRKTNGETKGLPLVFVEHYHI
jgi:hypothetical protein